MIVERDVPVQMPDGITLRVNVFRPAAVAPVVMSMTPYGKDKAPDRVGKLAMRAAGVRFGHLNCSRLTGFESPDPQFWVDHGYAVVQGDTRGMHASEGTAGFLTDRDARDYAEVIGWAAAQSWCTGAVGLNGVSYLCMSQWRVAALRPPGLKAIVAWEGASDLLREFAYHGGIPETGFLPVWWKNRMLRGSHRGATMGEDFLIDARTHPLDDSYWQAKRPDVAAIDVPALVAAGWGDHGLHTRGTLRPTKRCAGRSGSTSMAPANGRPTTGPNRLSCSVNSWTTSSKAAPWFPEPAHRDLPSAPLTRGIPDRTATGWPPTSQNTERIYHAASMTLIAHSPTYRSSTTYASSRRWRRTDRARSRIPSPPTPSRRQHVA